MKVTNFYRLELHWDNIDKNKDDSCNVSGAYFSGPVLKHADKIGSNDNIVLDLTPQYTRILTSHYFIKLEWGEVEYDEDVVRLKDVIMKGGFVNSVSSLSKTDYILIDTSKHDGEDHMYNLVYRAAVVNADGEEHENA